VISLRLAAARVVCRRLPPLAARRIGARLYSLDRGRKDNVRFVTRAKTGSYFTGMTADFNSHPMALYGHNEWRNWTVALALSTAGDTIIEVGANVGTETVGFSDLVGPSGRVIAFEPHPDNLGALNETLPLAMYKNVTLMPFAVGAEVTTTRFAAPPTTARSQGIGHILGPEESQRGTITDHAAEVDWPVIEVECVTLDSLADHLGPVRLLFVDAEGAEVSILQGGDKYLRMHRPDIVVEAVPDHLVRLGSSVEELYETLRDLGYLCFAFRRLHLEELIDPTSSIDPLNWLCVPESRLLVISSFERLFRRCALLPCVMGLNPLVGARLPPHSYGRAT